MPKISADSFLARSVRKMATNPTFRKVAPKILPPIDRAVHRVSKGRFSVSGALVPSLVLITTGAKSAQRRESPLACVPEGDSAWYVVGSNFGREKHPAWTANLIANPEAAIDFGRRNIDVTASLLTDEEKAEVWPRLLAVWPAYADYVEVSGRNLRVFRLATR